VLYRVAGLHPWRELTSCDLAVPFLLQLQVVPRLVHLRRSRLGEDLG
jgi:hypothetical protein